jgi:AcrR family transcriptional regulator
MRVDDSPTDAPVGSVDSVSAAAVERTLQNRRDRYGEQAKRLVSAYLRLIEETGDVDPPIALVLARAKIANKTFYNLFASKTELQIAARERFMQLTVARIESRMHEFATPESRALGWVDCYLERMLSDGSSISLEGPRYAARIPGLVTYPHPDLIAPLEDSLAELRGHDEPTPSCHQDALFLYDLVNGTAVRAIVANTKPSNDEIRDLKKLAMLIMQGWSTPQTE